MKYKVPIYVTALASKVVGFIECDTHSEYEKKLKEFLKDDNWEGINVNVSNDFEVGDSEIDLEVLKNKDDLQYYED